MEKALKNTKHDLVYWNIILTTNYQGGGDLLSKTPPSP